MKEFLVGEIEANTKKKILSTTLLFTMNQKSDFKMFKFAVNREKLLGPEHLIYIFKNKNKKSEDNFFAISVIKEIGNKNLQNWGFLTSMTNHKTYTKKDSFNSLQPYILKADATSSELTFGGAIKIKNNEAKMTIFNPPQYFEVARMSEIIGREDAVVEL